MIFDFQNTKVFNQEFMNTEVINHMQAVANPTIGGDVYVTWAILEESSTLRLSDEEQKMASDQLVKELQEWCDENGYSLYSF